MYTVLEKLTQFVNKKYNKPVSVERRDYLYQLVVLIKIVSTPDLSYPGVVVIVITERRSVRKRGDY